MVALADQRDLDAGSTAIARWTARHACSGRSISCASAVGGTTSTGHVARATQYRGIRARHARRSGPRRPAPITRRSSSRSASSARTNRASPRTTAASTSTPGGIPPNAASKAPHSRCRAASLHSCRSSGFGHRRSAMSPPGGTQAWTATRTASRARASAAAWRSAGKPRSDPLTPAMTRPRPSTVINLLPAGSSLVGRLRPAAAEGGQPRVRRSPQVVSGRARRPDSLCRARGIGPRA